MTSKILGIYNKLSEQTLIECIKDIKRLYSTGSLPRDSVVNKIKEQYCQITKQLESEAFEINIKNILWEAAQRWFDNTLTDRV